jgi:hypothetical protein
MDDKTLEPIEIWLKNKCKDGKFFPQSNATYFDRYLSIKNYLETEVYKWIGAGTSAEDQGIYTDHSKEHFNAVIRYAGQLLGFDSKKPEQYTEQKICLEPYEVYIMLVSILLHDAGNILGRNGHEKKPFNIFKGMGEAVCPDSFEARPIATIASVHGGKIIRDNGEHDKDTIRQLKELDEYGGIKYRSRMIAAIVRFADEICEDRNRSARFLLKRNSLPQKSEIFHAYANSISSVSVDLRSKAVLVKYELEKSIISKTYEKSESGKLKQQYLIDEINQRLEKMYTELLYCRSFMIEGVNIDKIKATVAIYDDSSESIEPWKDQAIELKESGYPSNTVSVVQKYPSWNGEDLYKSADTLQG